jgi:hypothetical protein
MRHFSVTDIVGAEHCDVIEHTSTAGFDHPQGRRSPDGCAGGGHEVQFGPLVSRSRCTGRRELADLAECLAEYRLDADPLTTFELVHQDQRLGVPHLAAL